MARSSRRLSAQRWRSTMWMWPMASGLVALVVSQVLTRWKPAAETGLAVLWQGDDTSAINVLQAVATSVMTATTLIFSLTVLALQLASQQFSPRLLRQFARDKVTKQVLSVLAGTFVFTISAMVGVGQDRPVPTIAVTLGLLLGVVSFGAILGFITHMVRVLRVDTMMLQVHDDTNAAIRAFYPHPDEPYRDPEELSLDPADATLVPAGKSGFVQATDVDALVQAACEADVVVRVEARAGDHITEGAPLATVWGRDGARLDELSEEAVHGIRSAVRIGYERTLDQDTGFGFRQLEDIAVKAMSPSINDPATAAHAIGHMADLLVSIIRCRLGPTLHGDADGVGRAIVPDRDLRYYLDLMCGQLRRFSASEPSVLGALLRCLRDVAVSCDDDDQRREIRRAADLVVETMDGSVIEADAETVHLHREQVDRALEGDTLGAYADRTGETRSM